MKILLSENITIEHLGYIPSILQQALALAPIHPQEDFLEAVNQSYGFPLYELGGTIKNGIYEYPNDPSLEPIAAYLIDGFTIFQYAYGIMAFMYDTPVIVRMD